jgi:GNAT superfamily N-acetyltransferase
MSAVVFRSAGLADAESVAELHADSWRRHYRGAYADAFLDGDIAAERNAVWTSRLATPAGTATVLAEYDGRLVGFVHVMLDDDPEWGSLVDNLHVRHDQHRLGIGTDLLTRAAAAVTEQAASNAMYLWVLEQNTSAQHFYRTAGGTAVDKAPVPPPGGDPTRLTGDPHCLRIVWPDTSKWGTVAAES